MTVDNAIFDAVCQQASRARTAQRQLAHLNTKQKNDLLYALADAIDESAGDIAAANERDIAAAQDEGMSAGLIDRLLFTVDRVYASTEGMREVAQLPDPVGTVVRGHTMDNGMRLVQSRIPLGVVGMIYEARPNVTLDVIALCIKSGNAVIVRGGHAAKKTNAATLSAVSKALQVWGISPDLVSSVDAYGRDGAQALMNARGYIDLLVPRGSAKLIDYVTQNAKVPIIETGAGNVHIYVDKAADLEKVVPIVVNAKTQRVGVCNAAEKLLVHHDVANEILPRIAAALEPYHVQLHCDDCAFEILAQSHHSPVHIADEEWDREYLDYILGIRVVDDIDQAIEHINAHSTGHTESIISEDYSATEKFAQEVDSAVIMINASTRFTDGGQFGFGAELGISTQKMHARGPMGLEELTTTHWVGYGTGQVRA